jgi:hypothetical protein
VLEISREKAQKMELLTKEMNSHSYEKTELILAFLVENWFRKP